MQTNNTIILLMSKSWNVEISKPPYRSYSGSSAHPFEQLQANGPLYGKLIITCLFPSKLDLALEKADAIEHFTCS